MEGRRVERLEGPNQNLMESYTFLTKISGGDLWSPPTNKIYTPDLNLFSVTETKVVWATNNDIQTTSVKGVVGSGEDALPDGERLPVVPRDLGSCELYPQMLKHNCNGRFVAVCGDGEFIIYTAQALRNKAFGQALDFVWSGSGTGDYCIRESSNSIKTFKNFKVFASM